MMIQARVIASVLVSLFFTAGCSSHGPHEELLGTSESPIIAGTPISDSTAENDGVVLIKAVQFEPLFNPVLRKTEIGSGSLLTNEWVLTAAHVVDQAASPADIEIRRGNAGDANAQVRRGIRTVIHPTWNRAAIGPNGENLCTSGVGKDVALVKVAPPFTGGTLRDISFDTLATINSGKTTHVAGYGESICDAKNSGTLRTADMQTAQGTAPYFTVRPARWDPPFRQRRPDRPPRPKHYNTFPPAPPLSPGVRITPEAVQTARGDVYYCARCDG